MFAQLQNTPYVKLSDVCDVKLHRHDLWNHRRTVEKYPIIGHSGLPNGNWTAYNVDENTIICTKYGVVNAGNVVKYNTKTLVTDGFSITPTVDNLNNDYLYYYLMSIHNEINNLKTNTITPVIMTAALKDLMIQVPSQEIQQEIVAHCKNINMHANLQQHIQYYQIKDDNSIATNAP